MSGLLNLLESTKFGSSAISEFNNEGIMPTAYHNGEYADFGSNRGFTFPAGCFGHNGFNATNFSCNGFNATDFSCVSYNATDFSCVSYNATVFDCVSHRAFNGHNDFSALDPLEFKTKITWSDIQTIYSNLNKTRRKYGIGTVSTPNLTSNLTKNNAITSLRDLINEMSSNSHVGSNASTSAVAIPSAGAKITTTTFTELNEVIKKAEQNCISFTGTS